MEIGELRSPDTTLVRREGMRVTANSFKNIAALLPVPKEIERPHWWVCQPIRHLRTFWILYPLLFVDGQHTKSALWSNPSASTLLAYAHRYRLFESSRVGRIGRVSWKLTAGDGLLPDRPFLRVVSVCPNLL